MENLNIRKIESKDDAALAELIRYNLKNNGLAIPGTVYFDKELDHLSDYYLASDRRAYSVLTDINDRVVGGVGLAEFEGIDHCCELQKLYLSDEMKGQGLGYQLVAYIKEQAKQRGYQQMYLETHTNLATAIHIYEKMGFESIERLPECVHSTMNCFYLCQLVGV